MCSSGVVILVWSTALRHQSSFFMSYCDKIVEDSLENDVPDVIEEEENEASSSDDHNEVGAFFFREKWNEMVS